MKYYRNPNDQQVYGYDPADQQSYIAQAVANGWEDVTGNWPPPPSEQDLKDACRSEAKGRLVETDFTQIADVAAALTNKAEFDSYRAQVRALFFNPVAAPSWPERPVAVWANT